MKPSGISILIISPGAIVPADIVRSLKKKRYSVTVSGSEDEALASVRRHMYDIAILETETEMYSTQKMLREIRLYSPKCACILVSNTNNLDDAVEAMRWGAFDYLGDPFSEERLLRSIRTAVQRKILQKQVAQLRNEIKQQFSFDNIVGKTPVMQEVFTLIEKVARTNASILISGSSGTGKEMVARAIHYNSTRRDKPFVAINCSAIPETLLESELFGYEKGAFTGAVKSHKGLFEAADGGTLLLDEIAEMPLPLQTKLLRVIENWEIKPIGSEVTRTIDVRLLAATQQDLETAVEENSFRSDLFYRLNVIQIRLPDLRDRRDDIPLLIHHFLKLFSKKNNKQELSISREAMEILCAYDWPGNVRELENVLERAAVLCSDGVIKPEDLPRLENIVPPDELVSQLTADYPSLESLERNYITQVLKLTNGKIKGEDGAAKMLDMNYGTLRSRMKKLGIKRKPGS
jgi:DNA-binding NtrC family response regulator